MSGLRSDDLPAGDGGVATPVARKRRSIRELILLTAAMFGFGFAFVPLYDALCQLTGLNGRDDAMLVRSDVAEAPDLSRTVTVQFLTTVNGGREWKFEAQQSQLAVHPGKFYTVNFRATNQLDVDVIGQAVPGVTPGKAARHLKKTECFCFTQQPFKAREEKLMPVRFMVERELPKDIGTVTLAYTFYDVTPAAPSAAPNVAPTTPSAVPAAVVSQVPPLGRTTTIPRALRPQAG